MLSYKQLKFFILSPSKKINDALKNLNKSQMGIVFICKNKKLLGIITEGDIRRVLIKTSNLDITLGQLCKKKYIYSYKDFDLRKLKRIFFKLNLKAIPIIEKNKSLIVEPLQMKILWWLYRLSPSFVLWLVARLWRLISKKMNLKSQT